MTILIGQQFASCPVSRSIFVADISKQKKYIQIRKELQLKLQYKNTGQRRKVSSLKGILKQKMYLSAAAPYKYRPLAIIVCIAWFSTLYSDVFAMTSTTQKINTVTGSYTSLQDYQQLLSDLFDGYDPFLRPRRRLADIVQVNATFAPISILDFDITGQAIQMSGYFSVNWFDELLTWNPMEYNGVYSMKVPLQKIWFPRLVIGNVSTI